MSVNTTVIEISPPMPAIEPMSKQWTTVELPVPDTESHGHTILRHWDKLIELISDPGRESAIDGESLNLATVVAVAR